ncbi:NAD(P)-dependent glycerol-3-phosphate dehydrogenase [bacterium]|nr:NAD(P)-dependent glycerol-3-phosphate dehydrogenase [bacterium]MBU1074273.1 NAD(P)-dependent glycerol-3-phosphate dehydrogenase [bacterium]MBU1674349.1 NAD(P)-dependent glycerol-3-phosphate dehydrogenase [bacterium]
MRAAILGSGSWGTAFGRHLAESWRDVVLWGIEADQISAIRDTHTNPAFFPDLILPANMTATLDLQEAVGGADAVFFILPSQTVRGVAHALRDCRLKAEVPVICLSKGLELSTLKRLSTVMEEELLHDAAGHPHRIGVLLGPSHAEEVVLRLPTALVLSGRGESWHDWQQHLSGPTVRVYTNRDLVGVEIAAAFKNVIAIAVGMADGLGYGDNTRGAVMTRGLKELARLGIALGGQFETFYGLSGIGDMITTCTSRHSRNRNYGEAVARAAQDPQSILKQACQVVEGAVMTQAALKLSAKHSIELPITQEVHDVLFSGKAPSKAMQDLMERALRSEHE